MAPARQEILLNCVRGNPPNYLVKKKAPDIFRMKSIVSPNCCLDYIILLKYEVLNLLATGRHFPAVQANVDCWQCYQKH
jgi:hypothetical protein